VQGDQAMSTRQQLDLAHAQAQADELARIAEERPDQLGIVDLALTYAEVLEEVQFTRRERDAARGVILRCGDLVERWTARLEEEWIELELYAKGAATLRTSRDELAARLQPELERD
jgi:hypothetical protein